MEEDGKNIYKVKDYNEIGYVQEQKHTQYATGKQTQTVHKPTAVKHIIDTSKGLGNACSQQGYFAH